MADQEPRKPRGNPNWVRGGASPNPGGRGAAVGELQRAVRRGVDADELVRIALDLARNGREGTKIAALQWLASTGYDRPAAASKVEISAGPTLPPDFDRLTPVERAQILDEIEAGTARLAGAAAIGLLAEGDTE